MNGFILIFILSFSVCITITGAYIYNRMELEYAKMEQMILTETNKVSSVLTKLLYKTQVLAALVIQNDGQVEKFERVAAQIVDAPCIKNVIIAPDGIVSQVYPLEGNEDVIGFDYFSEKEGNQEAIAAKSSGQLLNAEWYFKLSPIKDWYEYPETWIFTFFGCLISLSIAFLVLHNYDLKIIKKELEEISMNDPLTGVLNRRGIFKRLERLLEEKEEKFVLCYMDINKFKEINDAFGHNMGDLILQEFVGAFHNYADKHHILGRMGGDAYHGEKIVRQN